MAITPPVVDSEISASAFGVPVANQLNALAPTAWTSVTFQNSWSNFDGTRLVKYRKVGDEVQLRGVMKGGTTTYNVPAFTLPYAPPVGPALFVCGASGGYVYIQVFVTGIVSVELVGGSSNTYVYVDGVFFSTTA